jgi:hypothetical protein
VSTYYVGTRDGLYRVVDGTAKPVPGPSGATVVVDGGDELYGFDTDTVYRGLSESPTPMATPTDDPTHLRVDGEGYVVAGRDPLAVYTSDDGATWTTHRLPELPTAERWLDGGRVVVSAAGGQVSDTLRLADGLAVGVERTGVLLLADGEWERRDAGLAEDVHDLHRTDDTWLAATGQGLYRSTTAGQDWSRLDTGQLFQGYSYFHEFATHEGRLYTSGGRHMPGGWGDDGAEALVFQVGDGRSPLRAAPTPDPTEYTWALTATAGERPRLYAGTATGDVDEPDTAEGVLYERVAGNDTWAALGRLPAPVTSVAVRA